MILKTELNYFDVISRASIRKLSVNVDQKCFIIRGMNGRN